MVRLLNLVETLSADLRTSQTENQRLRKDGVCQARLVSSPWQQLDDTATRVNGQNQHCHVVGNPLYTSHLTTPAKDRRSVIDVLRNG